MAIKDEQQAPGTEDREEPAGRDDTDLSAADDDDDDDDGAPDPGPAAKGSPGSRKERREGRAGRYADLQRSLKESNDRAEKLARELEESRAATRREIDEIRSRFGRDHGGGQRDEVETALEDIRSQMADAIDIASNPQATEEQVKRAKRRYIELEEKRQDVLADRRERKRQQERGGQQEGQADAGAQNYQRQVLEAEYPEIMENEVARRRAAAYYQHLVENEGRKKGLATMKEAAAFVGAKMGLGGRFPEPSEADKKRNAGVGSREGGSNGKSPYKLSKEDQAVISGSGISARRIEKAMQED